MIRKATMNDCDEICRICIEDLGYDCKVELVKKRLEHLD